MSFRNKQPVPPTRNRSASASRNGSGSSFSYGSNRPRSTGFFNANTNPYSPYSAASNSYGGYSSPYSSYSSNYKSPYFANNYRNNNTNGNNGYASLTIPAKALANINVVTPNYSKMYENSKDYIKNSSGHTSRRDMHRNGSFHRDRSLSRSQGSLISGMGSRSLSLTSLNSEGYFVSFCY